MMEEKIDSKCRICGHSRLNHLFEGKPSNCNSCKCLNYICSFCGLYNATGRKTRAYYRSDLQHASQHAGLDVVFSPSMRGDEYLLYFFWMQIECGCWVEIDVQRDYGVDETEWFEFCVREGRTIEKRLERVASMWERDLDQLQTKLAEVANLGAIKG